MEPDTASPVIMPRFKQGNNYRPHLAGLSAEVFMVLSEYEQFVEPFQAGELN